METRVRYTAVFERAEEGGYIVTFPAIPNLATHGETLDEARTMAADCLLAYLESLQKDGGRFPYEAHEGRSPRESAETAVHAARLVRSFATFTPRPRATLLDRKPRPPMPTRPPRVQHLNCVI
jgi:predicted RNase H-like HicB family nuclease